MITIRPATLRDMTWVASNMRAADRREIRAVFPATDTEIGAALWQQSGELAWTAWLDDRAVCAFGIAADLPGTGSGWAYGTRDMRKVMPRVTRFMLGKVRHALLAAGYRRIEVRAAEDHTESHRWLKAMGFRFEGVCRHCGSDGLHFHQYAATRD